MKKTRKPLTYLMGLSILGLAVTLMQKTNLGMNSWDALNRNFYYGIPIDYRYLTPIVALVLITFAYIIEKRKFDIKFFFPLVISFYIGLVIDLLLLVIPDVTQMSVVYNLFYVFLAIIFIAIGLNMIIICNYPLPALDQFCLAISKRYKITFGKGKLIGEVIALVGTLIVGLIFKHQEFYFYIGPTTIIGLVFIGFFVDLLAKPVRIFLGENSVN